MARTLLKAPSRESASAWTLVGKLLSTFFKFVWTVFIITVAVTLVDFSDNQVYLQFPHCGWCRSVFPGCNRLFYCYLNLSYVVRLHSYLLQTSTRRPVNSRGKHRSAQLICLTNWKLKSLCSRFDRNSSISDQTGHHWAHNGGYLN